MEVTTEDGCLEVFDSVILATHSDVSLAMLGDKCPQVRTHQDKTQNCTACLHFCFLVLCGTFCDSKCNFELQWSIWSKWVGGGSSQIKLNCGGTCAGR